MTQAKIPASLQDAIETLSGISALLVAKEWERAAIVYAFTRDGGEGGATAENRSSSTTVPMTPRQFAGLGLIGLASDSSVRNYRKAWASAMEDGAAEARPGVTVELPQLPWKGTFGESTPAVQERTARSFIRDNPDAIERIVKENPQLGVEIARQVVATPATRVSVESRMAEHHRERDAVPALPERPRDYAEDITRAVNLLLPALRAVERNEWEPAPTQQMLLHFIGLLIDRVGQADAAPQDDLFAEIERFMSESVA
jgi:hypothetical protein